VVLFTHGAKTVTARLVPASRAHGFLPPIGGGGNLAGHPRAGLLFVDFERGDLLQLTGRARVVWEPVTAVPLAIDEVRETPGGLSLRFELVEQVKAHAAKAHGLEEITPELAARVKAAIQTR
jgi:hypothetical protein